MIDINNNSTGCNTQAEVDTACATTKFCLPQGIDFTTQSAIDSFQINFPNCTEIEGEVEISGVDIANLNGLGTLTSIGDGIWIHNNPLLTNLTGLNNVITISDYLEIRDNPALTSLNGLDNLVSIGGYFYIYTNSGLTDLT